MKKIFALLLVLTALCLFNFQSANAAIPAPDNHSVLILGPTVSGGLLSVEALAAIQGGIDNYGIPMTVIVDNDWSTYTAADFATYRCVVIGDPTCVVGNGPIVSAEATTNLWGGVVKSTNGHVVMIGSDPTFHYGQGGDSLIYGCMRFVLSGDPGRTKTAAYLCLSCYYNSFCTPGPITLLDGIKAPGSNFNMIGGCALTCYNNVHKTANHPALTNITDATISNWSCSLHEAFTEWDSLHYVVLAIAKDIFVNYTAPDGTQGIPYILARGATVISNITLSPDTATNIIGDPHTLTATVDSNGVPVAGVTVTFTVIGGPCAGVTGTGVTNNAGIATFTYTCMTVGTDFIHATFIDALGHTQSSNTVTKNWIPVPSPVEMSSFTSSINGRDVTLNWTTSHELNNASFDVERTSADGQANWNKVGTVAGNGTTNEPMNYSFVDRNVSTGSFHYRLKQIDYNGQFAYHFLNNEVNVNVPNRFELSQNYPNPFNPTTKINFGIPSDGSVKISIFDNTGKLVSTLDQGFKASGFYTVSFNASNLSSGIYFYRLDYNTGGKDFSKVMKMTIVK